jgi:hypothetical protein
MDLYSETDLLHLFALHNALREISADGNEAFNIHRKIIRIVADVK